MRCLTLAEALREYGATIEFITRAHPGNLNEYINSKGFVVHVLPVDSDINLRQKLSDYEIWLGVKQEIDAEETIQILDGMQVQWLIIDHYALNQIWEKKLRHHVRKIMVIDDLANRSHDCDLLLDQNYIHDENRYDQLLSPESIKLLGPKYALLRKTFSENTQSIKRKCEAINKVFIYFGGSDPYNLTATALKALAQPDLKHLQVDVVIGSTNLNVTKVKQLVSEHPNAELYTQVENIAELMTKADIALGAGGTTTWERMAVGLPSIIITIAENQVAVTKALEQDGYLTWLGTVEQIDTKKIHNALMEAIKSSDKLREQSDKGKKLITGMGTQTIANIMMVGPVTETLSVRRAKTTDCQLYWYWANDPIVRENAFNQQDISWEDHQAWFDNRLNDPDTILLLIESEIGPIGQVRFDYSRSHYMVDYSIGKQFRGYGLGKVILAKAIDYLRKEQSFVLIGDVKANNLASIKVFKQLGFSETSSPPQKDIYRFLLQCHHF